MNVPNFLFRVRRFAGRVWREVGGPRETVRKIAWVRDWARWYGWGGVMAQLERARLDERARAELMYPWRVRQDDRRMRREVLERMGRVDGGPSVGIVICDAGGAADGLRQSLASAAAQVYPASETVVLGRPRRRAVEGFAGVTRLAWQGDDAATNLNRAVAASEADLLFFLQPGDRLSRFAAFFAALALADDPEAGFVAAAADIVDDRGRRREAPPEERPGDRPGLASSAATAFFIRRAVLDGLGGFQGSSLPEAMEDLLRRCTDARGKTVWCPETLLHVHETNRARQAADDADERDAVRLREAIIRANPLAQDHSGEATVRLSLMILNRDAPQYVIPLLRTLVQRPGCGTDFEVIVGDTGSTDAEVLACYDHLSARITVVRGRRYHFSRNYNELAARHARGRILGILNNDLVLSETGVLDAVVREFEDATTGAVGAKLLYPDGRLQHGGIFFKTEGAARGTPFHRFHGLPAGRLSAPPVAAVPAVTGAFLFCRREDFLALGGFGEDYDEEVQDVDFCLKLRRLGREVRFLNRDGIVHIENATRPRGSENASDRRIFRRRWETFLEAFVLDEALNRC